MNNKHHNLGVALRITMVTEDKFFGPGVAKLMHLIDEHGSIHGAARAMEMSYSKAWKILKRANKELGYDLIDSVNGGGNGGKSRITDEGRDFLESYDKMSDELKEYANMLLDKYFKNK